MIRIRCQKSDGLNLDTGIRFPKSPGVAGSGAGYDQPNILQKFTNDFA
jgi:hypothetical protein